jgi:hypothetical protein
MHDKVKYYCKICKGCIHGRVKYYCKECKAQKQADKDPDPMGDTDDNNDGGFGGPAPKKPRK